MAVTGETSFGTVELQVSPEQMNQTATEIMSKIDNVQSLFANTSDRIRSTARYWEGDVGDVRRRSYENKQDDVDNMIKMLKRYVLELRMMAMNYNLAESVVSQISEALPTDVLE